VSYFSSENVTVPFYRELVEDAYGIIIFRAHSALRNETNIVDLFTSEKYRQGTYPEYSDLLSIAKYLVSWLPGANQSYFAITPSFIEKFGHFPHSIIIAMGCSSLKVNCYGMAQAFIDKGAKAYVGWTETVLPNDTDYETAGFLEMFLAKNRTLAYAVANRLHYYRDPSTNINVTSRMEFYPVSPSIGNLTISDLIAEAKNSKTLTMFNNFERFSFLIANINLESKDFLMD
jgi:hypothetical protein